MHLLLLMCAVALTGCGVVAQPGVERAPARGPVGASALRVPVDAQEATVVRQVDGDTVVLRGRGVGPLPPRPTKVRVLLVDTPEVFGDAECFGAQARDRFAQLAPDGAVLRVQADRDLRDRYDRVLLHLWDAQGRNVGQALVREGFATVLQVAPNRLHLEEFSAAEREARTAGRGLWSACPQRG